MQYTLEHYEHEDDNYIVITNPGHDIEILRVWDGYDCCLMTEIFEEGTLLKTEVVDTDQDWEDYIHDFFVKFKPEEYEI